MSARARGLIIASAAVVAACGDPTLAPGINRDVGPLAATASSDVTPPVLTALSFAPTSVNTTSAAATVTVDFSVTDDLAGSTAFCARFISPSASQVRNACTSFAPAVSFSGALDITFPQFIEAGTWTLEVFGVADAVGNSRGYSTAELMGSGFPTDLDVTSNPDVATPSLTALDFSPAAINATGGTATVSVSFTVTDDLSGAVAFCARFISPSSSQVRNGCLSFPAAGAHSGTLDITFPQFIEDGTWTLEVFGVSDAVANNRGYATSELVDAGFPSELDVTSNQDVTPPSLTALSFSPAAINTSSGQATVTVAFTVTDDLSGATMFCARFISPAAGQVRNACASFGAAASHTGSLDITFPQFAEEGTWTLEVFGVADLVANNRGYSTADLAAAGFPTDLFVGLIEVTIDIKPGADPNNWACKNVNNLLPVAVLSTATIDATTVNASTVRFGKAGTEAAESHQKKGAAVRHLTDVNGDGRNDLLFHFRFGNTGISCADIPAGQNSASLTAHLTGSTAGATAIHGQGTIVLKR